MPAGGVRDASVSSVAGGGGGGGDGRGGASEAGSAPRTPGPAASATRVGDSVKRRTALPLRLALSSTEPAARVPLSLGQASRDKSTAWRKPVTDNAGATTAPLRQLRFDGGEHAAVKADQPLMQRARAVPIVAVPTSTRVAAPCRGSGAPAMTASGKRGVPEPSDSAVRAGRRTTYFQGVLVLDDETEDDGPDQHAASGSGAMPLPRGSPSLESAAKRLRLAGPARRAAAAPHRGDAGATSESDGDFESACASDTAPGFSGRNDVGSVAPEAEDADEVASPSPPPGTLRSSDHGHTPNDTYLGISVLDETMEHDASDTDTNAAPPAARGPAAAHNALRASSDDARRRAFHAADPHNAVSDSRESLRSVCAQRTVRCAVAAGAAAAAGMAVGEEPDVAADIDGIDYAGLCDVIDTLQADIGDDAEAGAFDAGAAATHDDLATVVAGADVTMEPPEVALLAADPGAVPLEHAATMAGGGGELTSPRHGTTQPPPDVGPRLSAGVDIASLLGHAPAAAATAAVDTDAAASAAVANTVARPSALPAPPPGSVVPLHGLPLRRLSVAAIVRSKAEEVLRALHRASNGYTVWRRRRRRSCARYAYPGRCVTRRGAARRAAQLNEMLVWMQQQAAAQVGSTRCVCLAATA